MYTDRDFDPDGAMPANTDVLVQDLEIASLLRVMAGGDKLLLNVSRRALLDSLGEPQFITYRQDVLRDCLAHGAVVDQLFELTVRALEATQRVWRGVYIGSILTGSVEMLESLAPMLRSLRQIADEHGTEFDSEGFRRLFATIQAEIDDGYLAEVEEHLAILRFRHGVLASSKLTVGNKAAGYVLRRPAGRKGRRGWPFGGRARPSYSFQIHPRDEAGAKALQEIRSRGLVSVAVAVSQSADHVRGYFTVLQRELAFYQACRNLHARLLAKGEPTCFPEVVSGDQPTFVARGLYDPSLAVLREERVVGNDVRGEAKRLLMVTGANQGGKSTFLRSAGLAQLMMQAGMFVAAESFRAEPRRGIFTHFKREEDASMTRGKLDEELARMQEIADAIGPSSLVLCNESFASTNEREGSEIARQVVGAFVEAGVKMFFVTHLYDLAHSLSAQRAPWALFLRAERGAAGARTFRVAEGEPLPTSFGVDVYRRVFGDLVAEPS